MKRQEGFTLIELMVVILIIGILVAIAVPVFFSARTSAEKGACQDNLRTIDSAMMTYSAAEVVAGGLYPTDVLSLVPNFLKKEPFCGLTPTDEYVVTGGGLTTPPAVACPSVATHTDHAI